MEQAFVRHHTSENGLSVVEFFHPKGNSMPGSLLKELAAVIRACDKDESVSLVILKSAGERAFCAGASFDELLAIENTSQGEAFFMGFANVIQAMKDCSKLILGRVQGKAVGGGVGLIAATDFCLASSEALVKLSELNIGIGPFVIEPVLTRKIGISAFSELCLQPNRFQTAEWALQKGLYNGVVSSISELDEAIEDMARSLLATNPKARSALKKVFWKDAVDYESLLRNRATLSGKLVLSSHTRNALSKFKGQE